MYPSLSLHKHCNYVLDRIDKRNNMLMALARSSWGQEKETLLLTYNALGKSIASYAAHIWSTNASESSFKKIQTTHNATLRTATEAHKMAIIDHLHQESLPLRVNDHSDMLSAHGMKTQEPRPRPMKETLHSRHHSTVLPRLGSSRMESLQNLHTHAVDSTIQLQGNNRVLKKRPPPISDEEQTLHRRQRCTLTTTVRTLPSIAGLHLYILWSSTTRCETVFACTTHPTDSSPEDLWRNPVGSQRVP